MTVRTIAGTICREEPRKVVVAAIVFILSYPRVLIPLNIDHSPVWKAPSDVLGYVEGGVVLSNSYSLATT